MQTSPTHVRATIAFFMRRWYRVGAFVGTLKARCPNAAPKRQRSRLPLESRLTRARLAVSLVEDGHGRRASRHTWQAGGAVEFGAVCYHPLMLPPRCGRASTTVGFVAAGLSALAVRCTFDGLDQYTGGTKDAGLDGSSDGPPADVTAACAQCTDAQACVQGKCETCTATWSLVHSNASANGHYYEPGTSTLYVSSSRQVGDAA